MINSLKSFCRKSEEALLKKKKKKDILFYCTNEMMFRHTLALFTHFKTDPNVRVWYCVPTRHRFQKNSLELFKRKYGIKIIPHKLAVYWKWDLILYPNHGPYFRKECHKIYIGHGIKTGKIVAGDSWRYGPRSRDEENNIIYDKIFETNHQELENIKKLYPDHAPKVRVVGNLMADELLRLIPQGKDLLKKMHFDPAKKTVMVTSSWGPGSFAQSCGVKFIKNIEDVLVDYNVIFSLHPNNFQLQDAGSIDWHEILRNTKYPHLHFVSILEDPLPYLAAADILMTDFTSLGMYYLLLERPIIFCENGGVEFEERALAPLLREAAYVVHDTGEIKKSIQKAFEGFQSKPLKDLARIAFSYLNGSLQRHAEEIYELL